MFAALRQSRLDLSGNTGQNSLGFWVPAKIISVARICAARSIRVDDYDRHFESHRSSAFSSLHEFVQPTGRNGWAEIR
jgi:hypothetical protein